MSGDLFQRRISGTRAGLDGQLVATIESFGTTGLQVDGSNRYVLTGSSTVALRFGGGPVTMGQFGAWTPIGAEQSGGGYLVVWKNAVTDQYVAWSVDGGGNFLSQSAALSATSSAIESLETAFSQDLNGDGT